MTEVGRVNRISVAVLVDGSYAKNEKGEMVYQERSKDQLDRIAALVRSAIGFDQKRGDQVEVVNLKFAEAPVVPPVAEPTGLLGMLQFTKDDVMYVIELGVMMLLGLVVLFMVIRPLVKRILASEESASLQAAPLPALTDGSEPDRRPEPAYQHPDALIDIAQVQGQVHAQSVHRVGELAERNPNETATIVRQWLTETAAEPDMAVPQTTNANDISSVIAYAGEPSGQSSEGREAERPEARRDPDAGARRNNMAARSGRCSTTTRCANCRCTCRRSAPSRPTWWKTCCSNSSRGCRRPAR